MFENNLKTNWKKKLYLILKIKLMHLKSIISSRETYKMFTKPFFTTKMYLVYL